MAKVETSRSKILKRMEEEGWTLARHGAEHDVYVNPNRFGVVAVVPRHRTLTPGVARQIAKAAGWL